MQDITKASITNQPTLWKKAEFSQWMENGYITIFLSWPLASAFHSAAYNAIYSFAENHGYAIECHDGFELVDYKWDPSGNFVDRFDGEDCFIHLVLPQEGHRLELFRAINDVKAEVVFRVGQEQLRGFGKRCKELGVTSSAHTLGTDNIVTALVTIQQCHILSEHCLASSDGWEESDKNPFAEDDWIVLVELVKEERSLIKARRLHRPIVFAVS